MSAAPGTAVIATLADLLEATPETPAPETDAADVVAHATRMLEARAPMLATLQQLNPGPEHFGAPEQRLLEQLRARDDRWAARLQRARTDLRERMAAARVLRQRGY